MVQGSQALPDDVNIPDPQYGLTTLQTDLMYLNYAIMGVKPHDGGSWLTEDELKELEGTESESSIFFNSFLSEVPMSDKPFKSVLDHPKLHKFPGENHVIKFRRWLGEGEQGIVAKVLIDGSPYAMKFVSPSRIWCAWVSF